MKIRYTPLLLCTFLSAPAFSQLVINEVDYDQPGTDNAEYIELKNTGSVAIPMSNVAVLLVNGSSGAGVVYSTLSSDSWGMLAPGAYFTLCGDTTAGCNAHLSSATNAIQNGPSDAIALLNRTDSSMIDMLSYEGTLPGFAEGNGFPYGDDNVNPGRSIGRFPDGTDTNDNATDFRRMCNTLGVANIDDTLGCTLTTVIADVFSPSSFSVVADPETNTVRTIFNEVMAGPLTIDIFSVDGRLLATHDATGKSTWAWSAGEQHGSLLIVRASNRLGSITKRVVLP